MSTGNKKPQNAARDAGQKNWLTHNEVSAGLQITEIIENEATGFQGEQAWNVIVRLSDGRIAEVRKLCQHNQPSLLHMQEYLRDFPASFTVLEEAS